MVDTPAVLVVDDETLLLELLQNALEDGGFLVTAADTGERAVLLLERAGANFRAVVTDINLTPGKLTGWEVAKRARAAHPEVAIVYATGAHGERWASEGVPNSLLLTKPFAPAQVVTAVSQLLNAGSVRASGV
jgi:CheY-like chemotaxis protein